MQIRLRRDSDNAERDFDTSAQNEIAEWLNGGTGYVVEWHHEFPVLVQQPRFSPDMLGRQPVAIVAHPDTGERGLIFPELDNSRYDSWYPLAYLDQSGHGNHAEAPVTDADRQAAQAAIGKPWSIY